MKLDIYLVGVGGQGVLTVGEILAEAALQHGIAASFYPSKGMAQRGGFVKAQLRLGQEQPGPNIPERSAEIVVAMEVSEALKAVRFVQPGGEFVLLQDVWLPVPVLLRSKGASYPELEAVAGEVKAAGARLIGVDPHRLPEYEGVPVSSNVYLLGVLLKQTRLGAWFTPADILSVVENRWKKAAGSNRAAFEAGLALSPVSGPGGQP